jgi:hypothetical protein
MTRLLATFIAVALIGISGSVYGDTILSAVMTNAGESSLTVPTLQNGITPRPASFGQATFVLNAAQTAMTMNAQIFNIDFTGTQTADTNDNLTNAHIHASPTVTATTNAGVVWGFIGAPFNDNNPNDVIVTPFTPTIQNPNPVGGTVFAKWDLNEGNNTTLTAQLSNILNNEFAGDLPRSYINFHTTQFGGGEIRGFLTVVPEPSTVMLFACGLVGLVAYSRRRLRARVA